MNFKEFGWNGLFFEVPEEINFVRQGGNANSGNLRLQSDDYLVESVWEPFKPKKARSLSEVTDDAIKRIKKESKKRDVKILRKGKSYVSGHNALYMVVQSEVEERIFSWFCDESQRVLVLRFIFETYDKTSKKIMKHLFDTLKCHSEKSNFWSLLNVHFKTPLSFLLTDSKITVGKAYFMLTDRKLSTFADKTAKILVEYFSMANLVYRENYRNPDEWLEKDHMDELKKRFRERRIKFKNVESRRFKRHRMVVKQEKKTSGTSWRKTSIRTNATWYCSGMNRIYSVTVSSSVSRPVLFKRELDEKDHAKIFEDLLSSFKCH